MARKSPRTLREVLRRNKSCVQKFAAAELLAKQIFDPDSGYVSLPYFTDHGENHCKAVEGYLNDIIWGDKEHSKHDFVPTPEEAMYLLSTAWLHDIGMMYGIFDGEEAKNLPSAAKQASLRFEHELRTAQYIHEKWKKKEGCNWSRKEKTCLTNICAYHRRKNPIESFEPVEVSGSKGRTVRLRDLAALVRLADVCHLDQSRAPGPLMRLYSSVGMPQEAICHWERSRLISDVSFGHTHRKIVLRGHCPSIYDEFYLGSFDLEVVARVLCEYVEEELLDVQKVLSAYPNTSFSTVKDQINYSKGLDYDQKQQFLNFWPYLLDRPTSSSEAVAALIQMLLFAIDEGEKTNEFGVVWKDRFKLIMDKIEESRCTDFMVLNLCDKVRPILETDPFKATTAEKLRSALEQFMSKMEDNCHRMAAHAQKLITFGCAVMVYGFSSNIAKCLENIKPNYRRTLYIIACYRPADKGHLGLDENTQIIDFARAKGFEKIKIVPLGALEQMLSKLSREKVSCKVLLGTHGVYGKKGFLCKVGSAMIARTAKEWGATVIVFAESTKFLNNGRSIEDIVSPDNLYASDKYELHPDYKYKVVNPKMSFVEEKLIDFIVTEKGVTPARTKKTRVGRKVGKGKKGSS